MSVGAGIGVAGIWLGIGLMAFSPDYGGVPVFECLIGLLATAIIAATAAL